MKIVFWGTPAYAVPSLDALVAAGHAVLAVVSQPDRRRGRGKELQPSPVKRRALELGLPVFTPERIRHDQATQHALGQLQADVYVVVAFGQILPAEVSCNELLMNFTRKLVAADPNKRFSSAEDADLVKEGAASFHRQLIVGGLASEYDNEIRAWLGDLEEPA
jgi:hypothetical protein